MSAGVNGISAGASPAADWPQVRRPPSTSLRLPEEQAFKVATINQRLADTAARADQVGSALDLKA